MDVYANVCVRLYERALEFFIVVFFHTFFHIGSTMYYTHQIVDTGNMPSSSFNQFRGVPNKTGYFNVLEVERRVERR